MGERRQRAREGKNKKGRDDKKEDVREGHAHGKTADNGDRVRELEEHQKQNPASTPFLSKS